MGNTIIDKTVNATKWSVVTELVAKCITPVTNMILARILAPEAFGILATIQMVIAFAEIFVDSGFQKYLIQHLFHSAEEENNYLSTAFWTNLAFSFCVWGFMILFRDGIADMVGNPGLGNVIAIAGISIPLYGIIGIQNCKIRKSLDFKKLFYVRIAASLAPLVITVPLALLGLNYWALIIGDISGIAIRMTVLLIVGKYLPKMHFSLAELREMFSYTSWTLLNGIVTWLTTWIDALLIGRFLSEYYLGLYRNSTNLIGSIFTMVNAAITPVLFSSLSLLQNDFPQFKKVFLSVQKSLCMLLLPLGVGVFLYQDFATRVMLGSQWIEATKIIGITAIPTMLRTIYVSINGDVFRARGNFRIALYLQLFDLFITIPLCFFSLRSGFWPFVYVRALTKVLIIVPEIYFLQRVCNITLQDQMRESAHYYIATAVMACVGAVVQMWKQTTLGCVAGIVCCMITYFATLCMFKSERQMIRSVFHSIKK